MTLKRKHPRRASPIYELNLPLAEVVYRALLRSLAWAIGRHVGDIRYRAVPLTMRLVERLAINPGVIRELMRAPSRQTKPSRRKARKLRCSPRK